MISKLVYWEGSIQICSPFHTWLELGFRIKPSNSRQLKCLLKLTDESSWLISLYFWFGHRFRTFWPGQSKSHHLFGWRNPEMARICLLLEIKKKIYIENMINKEYNVFKTFSLVMTSLIWYYLVFWWSNVTDIIKYLQNINEFLNIWVQVVGKL